MCDLLVSCKHKNLHFVLSGVDVWHSPRMASQWHNHNCLVGRQVHTHLTESTLNIILLKKAGISQHVETWAFQGYRITEELTTGCGIETTQSSHVLGDQT